MTLIRMISGALTVAMLSGCATMEGAQGPRGPKLVGSGHATEYGRYGEIGIEFSSVGDFVALVSPSRWKSPIKVGGSLSWVNPVAWSEDPGRTSRILLGEALVGTAMIAATAGGGGGGSTTDGGNAVDGPGSGPPLPPSYIPE